MATIVDNLGTWFDLGSVTPSFDDWLTFPGTMMDARTFRLIFTTPNWDKRGYTFAWCRHIFYNDDVSWAGRVYPKMARTIIDIPIPEEFYGVNIVSELQIRKDGKFKVDATHVPWTVNAWYRISKPI
jgi:hypothetical protein